MVENDSIQSEQFDGAGEGTLGRACSWEEQRMGRVESIGSSLVRKRSWVGESMWVFFFFSVKKVINSQSKLGFRERLVGCEERGEV